MLQTVFFRMGGVLSSISTAFLALHYNCYLIHLFMASAKLDIRSLYIRNIYSPGRRHRSAIQEENLIPVRNLC